MSRAALDSPARALTIPEDPAARLAFTDRGVGNVSLAVGGGDAAAARERVAALVGLRADDAVYMEQTHGAGVAVVGPDDRGRGLRRRSDAVAGADAIVTRAPDVALVVLVADCVPVLLVDPGRAVAAVHAGRRGVATGVVGASVAVMTDAPERVVAVVGPAIGGCCYELPREVVDAVAEVVPTARTETRRGTPALDLPAAVREQLAVAGVATVRTYGACTRCHPQRWFSHRGDAPETAGRQAGVVCRRRAPETPFDLPGGRGGVA
ncbi:MAG TPA: peptidoglycan editing factor PgeF [Egibacteraceae bacterium]|nr:peptidoglycan editing factor PgeF [Egibacteraceae bacterium]